MAKQNSFDIVSQVDMAEVKNAVNQAMKEVTKTQPRIVPRPMN